LAQKEVRLVREEAAGCGSPPTMTSPPSRPACNGLDRTNEEDKFLSHLRYLDCLFHDIKEDFTHSSYPDDDDHSCPYCLKVSTYCSLTIYSRMLSDSSSSSLPYIQTFYF